MVGLAIAGAGADLVRAQHALTGYTLDGGGAASTDGYFFLEGVIGQADAGRLSDGHYTIEGGFLSGSATLPPGGGISPARLAVALGSPITLSATPTGTPPFQYVWRLNGVVLDGQTNATLSLPAVTLDDLGTYTVVYLNAQGAAVSEETRVLLNLPFSPVADDFADRITLSTLGTLVATNLGATREKGEPLHAGKPGGRSVWFQWNSGSGDHDGIATFSTRGSGFDTLLAVYTGAPLGPLALTNLLSLGGDDDRGDFLRSEVRFNVSGLTDYYIAVDGLGGAEGEFVLDWDFERTDESLPVLTNQPVSVAVPLLGPALFEVNSVRGGATYQWYFNDVPQPGQTTRTYAISSVDPAEVGRYYVAVTNSDGRGVLSDTAVLEIGSVPTALSKPKVPELRRPAPAGGGGGSLLAAAGAPSLAGMGGGVPADVASVSVGTGDFQYFQNYGQVPDDCNACGVPTSGAQWFLVFAENNGLMTLDTMGSGIDTVMAVYVDTPDIFQLCDNLVACDADGGPDGLSSLVAFPAVANTSYLVSVSGADDEEGLIRLNWKLCPFPAPMAYLDNQLVLLAPPNPHPFAADTNYYWRRDGDLVGVTSEPMLPLMAPPLTPEFYTVRYVQNQGGLFSDVTNTLGNIFTAGFGLSLSGDGNTFHLHLDISALTSFQLEYASPVEHACGEDWLWLPTTNYTLVPQESGVRLDIPAGDPSRFYRVRPPAPASSLPGD